MKAKKLFKLAISTVLATAMVMGSSMVAFADVTEEKTVTDKVAEEACEVTYELESDGLYTVKIPKKITLGEDKSAEYTVTVSGDISSANKVTVVPDDTFLMKDVSKGATKKGDVEATVTLDKQAWTWDEVVNSSVGKGTISAEDLSAGSWAGTFNFAINLVDTVDQNEPDANN